MATQPIETGSAEESQSGGDDSTDARNFESEAKIYGWTPKEEFKGDPEKWVDAEAFVRRADEVMPLLKSNNRKLMQEIEQLKRSSRQAQDFFAKSEERGYQRALKDIQTRQREAFDSGDTAAFERAQKDMESLEKPAIAEKSNEDRAQRAQGAFDDWRDKNVWYDRGALAGASEAEMDARAYADRMTEKHLDKTKEMDPEAFFDFIGGLVNDKYGARLNGKQPSTRRASPVEAVSGRGVPGRRTFNDLPPEAQQAADRFIRSGIIKSREDYVKNYPWDDKR